MAIYLNNTTIKRGNSGIPIIYKAENLGKEVNFLDYDGTILYSYTAAEFAALSSMPENPTHDGLTAQGWNWSLANAKAHVAKYGKLDIGQMYITDDGKTRIYIHLEEGRTSPVLGVCPNGTVDIDWGDGTTHDTLTGSDTTIAVYTSAHSYATPGDYVIQLTVTGSMGFKAHGPLMYDSESGNRDYVYKNAVQKVELGSGVTSIVGSAFSGCYSLSSITIPDSVISIGEYAFGACYSLSSITIPDGITSIDSDAFNGCYSLSSITIPNSVTSIGSSAFQNCPSLSSIAIPDGITSIGSYAFQNCYSLSSITIPDGITSITTAAFNGCYSLSSITIPDGVTSISNNAFRDCPSLSSITIPNSVTSIGSYAFRSCRSLSSITIPNSVTSIGSNAFYDCYSLSSITIPDGITRIDSSVFYDCYSLSSITIPNSVTNIDNDAFNYCFGVAHLYFLPTTPPRVFSSNAFSRIPTDCVIHVPVGSLSAYTSATNYPSSSTYTYVEDIV